MISWVRVDNRLIHGQVVEAWIPHLKVGRVVVADDESAKSPLIRSAMGLAVQSDVQVQIKPLHEVDFEALGRDAVKTLVLVRDVAQVTAALVRGLSAQVINLGNVHFGTGRKPVSPSVFLSAEEITLLESLVSTGVKVEAQAVPAEKPVPLAELVDRFQKAS